MTSARVRAAGFRLTIQLPALVGIDGESGDRPNVFPIKDFAAADPAVIGYARNRASGGRANALNRMLRRLCRGYRGYDLPNV